MPRKEAKTTPRDAAAGLQPSGILLDESPAMSDKKAHTPRRTP
jgi:hypothetical protein